MKVVKPLKLGVLPRPYVFAGKSYLCTATFVSFRLGTDGTGTHIVQDHQAWPSIHQVLPAQTPLDFGVHKGCGEVLVAGRAFTPDAAPRQRLEVRLQLGSVDKRLLVQGDRQWQAGIVPTYQESPPAAFTTMPLTFDRAFGGEGYEANPSGKGYRPKRTPSFVGETHGPLPNLQYPGEQLKAGAGSYLPASFLPQELGSPDRMRRAGTYDGQWLKRDFPGFARDVDWSIFNVAPTDQRLRADVSGPVFFAGGESYRLENLHPTRPVLTGTLPEVRVRNFLRTEQARCSEVSTRADTVWFFPEFELGVMVFHGTAEVADSEALDVQALMVAYENSADPRRPLSHYASVLDLRLDPVAAAKHAFHESQLCPPRAPLGGPSGTEEHMAVAQAAIDEVVEDLRESFGGKLPEGFTPPKAKPPAFPVPSRAELASGDFDLTAMIDGAQAAVAKVEKEAKVRLEALKQLLPAAQPPPVDVSHEVEQALEAAAGGMDAGLKKLAALSKQTGHDSSGALQQLAKQKHQLQGLVPKTVKPEAAADVGRALGRYVVDAVQAGRSLRGAVLTGVHLQGVNLGGCDLEGVVLANAKLVGVNMHGARLKGASFAGSELEDVDLGEAELSGAIFNKAQLRKVTLTNANLSQSQWAKAELEACELSRAQLQGASFTLTKLNNCLFRSAQLEGGAWLKVVARACDFTGASISKLSFLECQLPEICLCETDMHRVSWLAVHAPGARFDDARLHKVLLSGKSSLPGASFRRVVARECGFRGADLVGANFSDSTLSGCDLAKAELTGACMDGALVSRSMLREVQAGRSSFRGTDLYKSALSKAVFDDADFRDASLMGVEAAGAVWDRADLRGANPKPERRT